MQRHAPTKLEAEQSRVSKPGFSKHAAGMSHPIGYEGHAAGTQPGDGASDVALGHQVGRGITQDPLEAAAAIMIGVQNPVGAACVARAHAS